MKVSILIITVYLLSSFLVSCGNSDETTTAGENAQKPSVAVTPASGNPSATEVAWFDDWNKGMEAANKANKPVYVHFTADWCTWCKKMEKETYSSSEIKKRMANDWITIKIDTEDSEKSATVYLNEKEKIARGYINGDKGDFEEKSFSNQQLVGMFGGSLPTLLFIDKGGNFVYPNRGYLDKGVFGPMLDYFRDELYTKDVKLQEYIDSKS
ncbi:thioredoxin family protein [Candidatus Latescibacterota bacterium]